ncbi:uncharacterized protein LOC132748942 [Ruditapes philippinarum]|uniref:uncharacterized protein LOC132748942 n=1 Tax=Ruditapes philippinarum TaxID=129788 RepID=UPI00295BB3E7|nr:uncharacterized protein LOC132748942 [Ruditapes philippinarum]
MYNHINPQVLRIKRVTVGLSQFPRFAYALDNMIDVVERYPVVLGSTYYGIQTERCISFYLCTTNGNKINDFIEEEIKNGKFIKMEDVGPLEQFVESQELSDVFCFELHKKYEHIMGKIGKGTDIVFILNDSDREARGFSDIKTTDSNKNGFFLQTCNNWKQIDTVLEKWLFQSFNTVCLELARNIESNHIAKSTPDRCAHEEKQTGKRTSWSHQIEKEDHHKQKKENSTEHKVLRENGQANEPNIFYIREGILSTLREDIKVCLMTEMIGLFNMSDISFEGIPNIFKDRHNMDIKKISRDLFSKVDGLHGIGYRMQKLQVVVKDGQMFETEEKQRKLRQALNDLNVYEYEIVPFSMNKYLTSGDEIAVGGNRGSFGCFAKTQETKDESTMICGLLSKHVASTSELNTSQQEIELRLIEDGEPKGVGNIIRKTICNGCLDIAAAALSITEDECDTRFKTASGLPRKSGKLYHSRSKDLLGQKVHMWGAKSKPGKGIITVPEYICEGMDHSLIQVEDMVDGNGIVKKRFAQPGDSGAIACTDVPGQDFVNLVSMNMGCLNYKEVEEDDERKIKKQKGKYLTVPLPSGLEEISKRIGKNVELF